MLRPYADESSRMGIWLEFGICIFRFDSSEIPHHRLALLFLVSSHLGYRFCKIES